jgi:molybdopterin adenylyltransferase
MGYSAHKVRVAHEGQQLLPCAIITVSDTRTPETDESGTLIREGLTAQGHQVVGYAIVRDEAAHIATRIDSAIDAGAAVVILNGGTGIARRDSTFEAVDGLLEKRLPGFGELFRMLSYVEIGAGAMLLRATAGTYRGALIFSLPGSPHAVGLALDKLILPELPHLVWETVRKR